MSEARDDPADGPLAVVDIGSGAAKLLIVEDGALARRGEDLVHHAVRARLLSGADDGRIDREGLAELAGALDTFAGLIGQHRTRATAAVGTAWTRQVDDLGPVAELVTARLGVELESLSGMREAELAFAGALLGRPVDGPAVVIDIGAASTEFAVGGGDGVTGALSLPIGARTLTDQYLTGDPPRADELSSALSVIELYLDDLRRELPAFVDAVDSGTVIGVGATGAIAEVEIGLPDPDAASVDGYVLEKAAVEEVFRALATESAADRAHNPGLRPGDVEDIVGSLCVAVEFLRQFGVGQLVVSDRGVMHGRAAELAANR